MKIKMLQPFRALKVGQVLEQTDGVAEFWIQCGRAERMVPETIVEVKSGKRRRGRPRNTVTTA